MASNFGIIVETSGGGFSLKLAGDFDATSAHELIHTIKKLPGHPAKISVYTTGLRSIHPFGIDVFSRSISLLNGRSAKIVFKGNHAQKLASATLVPTC